MLITKTSAFGILPIIISSYMRDTRAEIMDIQKALSENIYSTC